MISLVTLAAAKRQVHVMLDDTAHDEDLYSKIRQASEIVMNHAKYYTVPVEWEIGTSPQTYDVPQWAQAATLIIVSELFLNRESSNINVLSDAVRALIPRTPTLA